ncbi:MAG: tryptophan--tRNA ligase [Firmicutes bacterium]|nr:tryptophan--tRNA ligase [Bacillota bacterium]
MSEKKGTILSAMRPTGKLHLGNLFGALENWIKLQDAYHCFFSIADWHALTTAYEKPQNIKENTREMVLDWLSCGIDPQKAVIFKQSDVKEHAELHLLLSMIAPLSWLERVPTYKEQLQQVRGRNLATYGFLGYPLLQAADILIYNADAVPVGEDQAPHIELTREIARRFNYLYDQKVFSEPETILNEYKLVPGLDGRKMSKSYDNVIEISIPPSEIPSRVRMMITDPGRIRKDDPGNPQICSIYAFHRIFNQKGLKEIETSCREGKIGCVECKNVLSAHMQEFLEPIYCKRGELEKDPQLVERTLEEGAKKAQKVARETLQEVRFLMGLS